MTENKIKKKSRLLDLLPLAIGEVVVILLVLIGFLVADLIGVYDFGIKIISGALLGAIVILGNHLWLVITVDRKIDQYLEARGSREMSEEEAAAFTKSQTAAIQGAMGISSVIRTVSMLAVLVIAFLTGWFNPLAAAIPMFALRPILTVAEMIKSKHNPKPDPSKFIKYEDQENDKEKEDE